MVLPTPPLARGTETIRNSLSTLRIFQANNRAVPDKIDWRESGYVTGVKDQGNCGSCWAFSTTGTMEGQFMKNERTSISFSEQQLVDCSGSWGNNGCGGGLMENAYEYLKQFGLETESSYPYRAVERQCRYNRQLGVAKVTGYYTLHSGNEAGLKSLVGSEGPAAVAVDVESDFMMYRSGACIHEQPHSRRPIEYVEKATKFEASNSSRHYQLAFLFSRSCCLESIR
ncbi:unnamed protein product [Fasciola hepatica]|uniref:Peptidase C1A papain C-terminal domain-containing protein n=1 Tax=Fasciola hepatica TaxID=6192 RepID=A0ABC9HIP1_FASHE